MMASEWFEVKYSVVLSPLLVCETLQCIGRFILYKLTEEQQALSQSSQRESSNETKQNQSMVQSVTFYIAVKAFLVVQGLLVVLRVDRVIDWEWLQIFWTTWVVLAFFFGLSIGIFCVFLVKLCRTLAGVDSFKESMRPF